MNDILKWFEAGIKEDASHFLYIPPKLNKNCESNNHIFKSRRIRRRLRKITCKDCGMWGGTQFKRRKDGKWCSLGYAMSNESFILNNEWMLNLTGQ